MNPVLSVRRARLCYGGVTALADVGFDLAPDTITVLLGANGAGKSTLLRAILGLERLDKGSIRVGGFDPRADGAEVRRRTGYVPDHPDAYGWMTVRDLRRFLRDEYPGWSEQHTGVLLERAAVPQGVPLRELSRGKAALAMLALALAPEPSLLLLDEPSARLAPTAREELLGVLLEIAPADGGAILVSTHDLELASRLADRVLVLEQGRIAAELDVRSIRDGQSLARVQQFLRELYPAADLEVVT